MEEIPIRLGYSVEPDALDKYTELLYTPIHHNIQGDVKILVDSIACQNDMEGKSMYEISKLNKPSIIAVHSNKIYCNFPAKDMDVDGILMFEVLKKRKGYPLVGIMRDPQQPTMQEPGRQYPFNEYAKGALNSLDFDHRFEYSKRTMEKVPLFIGSSNFLDPPGEVYYELRASNGPRDESNEISMQTEATISFQLPTWMHAQQNAHTSSASSSSSAKSSSTITQRRRRIAVNLHSGCMSIDRGVLLCLERKDDGTGDKPGKYTKTKAKERASRMEHCSYRYSDFDYLIPLLTYIMESQLSNKPKQCILKNQKLKCSRLCHLY